MSHAKLEQSAPPQVHDACLVKRGLPRHFPTAKTGPTNGIHFCQKLVMCKRWNLLQKQLFMEPCLLKPIFAARRQEVDRDTTAPLFNIWKAARGSWIQVLCLLLMISSAWRVTVCCDAWGATVAKVGKGPLLTVAHHTGRCTSTLRCACFAALLSGQRRERNRGGAMQQVKKWRERWCVLLQKENVEREGEGSS